MVAASPATIPSNLGDLNDDGKTNNFDLKPFDLALASPSDYLIEYPAVTDYADRGDINRNGTFDNGDAHPFEILLTLGIVVSEPPTAALLAIGCVGLLILRRARRKQA